MKPTPTQALALRALQNPHDKNWERPKIYLRKRYSTNEIYEIENYYTEFKIRVGTAKVLLKNDWIEKLSEDYNDYVISQAGKSVLELLNERDFIRKQNKPLWSSNDILDALKEKYRKLSEGGYQNAPRWVYFSELQNYRFASRRVDFWAMACWPSENYKRIAYEIKVTRADFLNELKDPTKRDFAMEISNQFFFITPPDLIKENELPEGCGLIELSKKGNLTTRIKAPIRKPDFVFTWDFIASLGRKIFKQT